MTLPLEELINKAQFVLKHEEQLNLYDINITKIFLKSPDFFKNDPFFKEHIEKTSLKLISK